jgi:indolepyruvate decarboxylase
MKLGQALLQALAARGAGEVFGIPGDFALPLFRVIEQSRVLPLYTLSHEPSAGFAADAAARMRCAPGVAAVTYGAGALNLVNAVTSAYAEKSPLVVLSGGPGARESASGLLLHHQVKTLDSQARLYREITCAQTRLADAAAAPAEIARVLDACCTYSRPVYIEVPRDMAEAELPDRGGVLPPAPEPLDGEALAACADEILARLARARRPLMMVGIEVRRFRLEARVAQLARRLGAPVVTSFMGRGLLVASETPPLGTYIGAAGQPQIAEAVEQSDALLLLGVILSDTNFGVSAQRVDLRHAIHAFDGAASLGFHVYPRVPLAALVETLLARLPAAPPRLASSPAAAPAPPPRGLRADEAPLSPLAIATAINDAMATHGAMPIAADVGDCLFTTLDLEHTATIAPGYYASMGFGVPAGLGLQAATGERPIVLVGDGAFQMNGMELGHCARYGWNPIVIVFNNGGWEMLRAFEPASGFNDLGLWNFAPMAQALGGDAARVSTRAELAAALARALRTRGRFQLIEAMIPRGVRSPTLQRFVDGVRRVAQPA